MTESQESKIVDNEKPIPDTRLNENLKNLSESCSNNAIYFSTDSSENGQRLYISFLSIIDHLEQLTPKIEKIESCMHKFDFNENTPGNGYRSFISIVEGAIIYALDLALKIQQKRDSVLFRKTSLTKDIESCSHLFASLDTCLIHLETLLSWSSEGNLFPNEEHSPQTLISKCEDVNQYCFYGRSMGFQYCESLKNVLKFITLTMAIFSETYYSRGSLISRTTNSVVSSTRYLTDPDIRARRIVDISKHAGVDFCKAFWFLSEGELMSQIPAVVSPSVAVSTIIQIPSEPLSLSFNGKDIHIPVPSSYLGERPVQVRLISHFHHDGSDYVGAYNKSAKPATNGLLIHCHGGGFVAQSSKSHECYLRDWANRLDVPVLSIDYSLAPEAPFPRALEEVVYAYCWALKNCKRLGSTGEKIIAAGDSAGANLLLCASLKCIELGVPPPNGLFLAYVPTIINFIPSPARLLCLMDPLLPFGFLMRCLKAYAVPDPSKIRPPNHSSSGNDLDSFEEITESDLAELQARKSLGSEASEDTLASNFELDKEVEASDLTSDVEQSEKYVSDLLEKYVLDSDSETDGTKQTTVVTKESMPSQDNSLHSRVRNIVSGLRDRFNSILETTMSSVDSTSALDTDGVSMREEFNFSVPPDFYMSPIYAPEHLLRELPPVRILTVELDPCLDDCVMFSKRLQTLNKDIEMDILKGLPHGFLNFSLVSKEAYEGSMQCVKRIKELFDLPNELKRNQ